jgi:hypothetical protein
MFQVTYDAIKQWVLVQDTWFTEVDMFSGKQQRKRVENLDAFWPGMEATLGFTHLGAQQLNAFYAVATDLGFLPEEIDFHLWQSGKGALNGFYPLRPELIESTYHQYRTTKDRSWLQAGRTLLESIEKYSATSCGYASVQDVATKKLADVMPSFFLSETCKYLFLLFDEHNFVNQRPYVFSTEAHLFDAVQVYSLARDASRFTVPTFSIPTDKSKDNKKLSVRTKGKAAINMAILHDIKTRHLSFAGQRKFLQQRIDNVVSNPVLNNAALSYATSLAQPEIISFSCPKGRWWDKSGSYEYDFLRQANSALRSVPFTNEKKFNRTRRVVMSRFPYRIRSLLEPQAFLFYSKIVLRFVYILTNGPSTVVKVVPYLSKLSWLEVEPSFFSQHRCSAKDIENSNVNLKNKKRTRNNLLAKSGTGSSAIKTLDMSMGVLGQFSINVFGDGFSIFNSLDQTSLEILNVGRPLVLVRESVDLSRSFVVMSNSDSQTVTRCSASLWKENSLGNLELFGKR